MKTIPEGDFYSCSDGENLSFTDAAEAVQQHLENYAETGSTLRGLIAEHCPLTLTAYERVKVDPAKEAFREAQRLAEYAAETWAENYGGPDGEMDATDDQVAALATAMEPALRAFFQGLESWNCEEVGSVELSSEDVTELLAEELKEEVANG